jgi:hypothetical protein
MHPTSSSLRRNGLVIYDAMHSVALKIFLLVEVGNKKQEVTKKENIHKGI